MRRLSLMCEGADTFFRQIGGVAHAKGQDEACAEHKQRTGSTRAIVDDEG